MLITNFIGRTEELTQIKTAWNEARKGQPQIINLIADTGVGKTRIVHAFYEWLNTDESQDDSGNAYYWPKVLGTGRQHVANPPLENFGSFDPKNNKIPWLWWGMYWTDNNGEQECALGRFHEKLKIHLDILEIERRFKSSLANNLFELLKDEGIELVAENIPGVKQVLSVNRIANAYKAKKESESRALKGLIYSRDNKVEALEQEVLEHINKFFRHSKADVPLVLFLDDIHFSIEKIETSSTLISKDSPTLKFLDELLRQAAKHNWPLLVIATHWKSEWLTHLHETISDSKPWPRILNELVDGNVYTEESIHNLQLGGFTDDDMRAIMQSVMPGLTQDEQRKIVERVDNVRWMVELLTALNDNVDNFEQQNRLLNLSSQGQLRLEELLTETNGYLGIIRKRLESDTMHDVRPLLGATAWHAHGLEFLSALIGPIGDHCLINSKVDPRNVMLKAINPAAFLEDNKVDGSDALPSLLRFPERGYLEVSRQLFDKSKLHGIRLALAKQIIESLTPPKDGSKSAKWQQLETAEEKILFLEIARKTLKQVEPQLSNAQKEKLATREEAYREMVADGGLTTEEVDERLKQVKEAMLAEQQADSLPEATLWKTVATVELVALLDDEGMGRAQDLAFEVDESSLLDQALPYLSDPSCLALGGVLSQTSSRWTVAHSIFDYVIDKYSFKELLTLNEYEQHFFGYALLKQAMLFESEGNTDSARRGYENAVTVYEQAIYKFGEYEERLSALIFAMSLKANFEGASGNSPIMRANYQQILIICEKLIREHGRTPESLHSKAVSIFVLASLDEEVGDVKGAQSGYEHCREIFEHLLIEFGETPIRLRYVTLPIERLADLELASGNVSKAKAAYEYILNVREHLLSEYGETSERLIDVSIPIERLADIERDADNFHEAIASYKRYLKIGERLVNKYGETAERLLKIIIPLERIGSLYKNCENITSARSHYERCRFLSKKILNEFGESPERLKYMAIILERLADLDEAEDNFTAAQAGYKNCHASWMQLIREFGETPERLDGISVAIERLADLEKNAGKTLEAKFAYERCLKVREKLINKYGETPERLRRAIIALERLGNMDNDAEDITSARSYYERSLFLQERLVTEYEETPEQLRDISLTIIRLADIDSATGNSTLAKERYKRSLAIYKYLHNEHWDAPELTQMITLLKQQIETL